MREMATADPLLHAHSSDALSAATDETAAPVLDDAQAATTSTLDRQHDDADAADALAVVKRIDFSPLVVATNDRADDGEAHSAVDSLDREMLFYDTGLKVDVSADLHMVVGFRRALFRTRDDSAATAAAATKASPSARLASSLQRSAEAPARAPAPAVRVDLQALELLSDGSALQLDDDEHITDVKWVGVEYFCASYSSGVIRIFSRSGKLVLEQKFHTVAVKKLDVSRNASTAVTSRRLDVQLQTSRDADGELWILYEDATVAIIQVSELLSKITSAVFGPAQASKFRKYQLRDQADVVGAVPCGSVRPTIFQSHPRIGVCTIISAGADPFLSFYQAGNDQNSIIHLAHIATAMATRAAGAVWSFAKSWGWSSAPATHEQTHESYAENRTIDDAAEHVAAPVGSIRSIAEDTRRRSRCLALSPTGRLAAVTDTLGRVLLIDTARMLVIRMWKGYRNAQCAWMQASEGARRPRGLYLVIYSAQRGIVEVWRARFGPRVYSFAVGDNARLFTIADASGGARRATRCVVLATSPNGTAELIELLASLPNVTVLLKYFTQNKLQEENFVLHQITAGLHAFVKKVQKHTSARDAAPVSVLEQDTIGPLLDDMASLSSTTTIDALLDLLVSSDMMHLSPTYIRTALERIQSALKREMSSHIPTGPELSLLWKTQWQHRIVSAFIGLHGEFERSKRVAASSVEVSSAMLTTHRRKDLVRGSEHEALDRLFPWLELFRRAGFALDDDACPRARQTLEEATRVTTWEFLELFSMPFSEPELPRRRDILALFEQSERSDEFLRNALQRLRVPVFRPLANRRQRDVLLALAFTPILSSVFAVQELQQVHAALFLSHATHTSLFLEWFFALPLGTVLALAPPSSSSSLQRWLQPYFAATPDSSVAAPLSSGACPDGGFKAADASTHTLFPCSAPLAEVFDACWKTPKLFHAFVLAVHCGWGEQQHARRIEEATLGAVSSAGAGVRWTILQDALAKAVHLSLRVGRMGRLSVEAVENVDDILRALALLQLNEGVESEQSLVHELSRSTTRASADDARADAWVTAMEHCRHSSEMRDWRSVVAAFPQFADDDALRCFRVLLLCTAWNAERSDMHQLDDALGELDAIASPTLRAAMGTHVWEKFIRVHVVTLMSFWEESAAGKTPQRGLQPQIARRFFRIIKSLVEIVVAAVRAHASEASAAARASDIDATDASASEDESDELEDDRESAAASFTMRCLTPHVAWPCAVRDLATVFQQRWPPAHRASALLQSLARFRVAELSRQQLADHLSLVLLLDSFAATRVTPVSIVKLFGPSGRHLCRPDSFVAAPSVERRAADAQRLALERTQFLKQLLRHDEVLGIALAEAFGLSVDMIREEHVLFLYQSGRDELAEHSLDHMKAPERLGLQLAAIARARLSLILQRMKTEAEFAMLMSVLPADVFAWVISESQPPLVADAHVRTLDRAPSLTSTHYLLLKCLAMLSPHAPEFPKITAMSMLVKDIISQVKQHGGK